eukprot:9520248-Karenia_brevis.AAC.1
MIIIIVIAGTKESANPLRDAVMQLRNMQQMGIADWSCTVEVSITMMIEMMMTMMMKILVMMAMMTMTIVVVILTML